ncbi:phage tail protein [Acinetobacter populi]|uniref:Phage tail protein n=1 Tax=Acinetobacter populi TaxID=1582270 RepID=A0A1Z9Z2M0_9GAMM|nr:phage tail protein [Acinetobacter populi]OUY08710.1 hypothetical protein CAP51_03605 [Acinetobacter populi]
MATYKGILTNNGKALIANATVNNKINYPHIAIGDGNGSVPAPSETRPNLVNEKARIALNVVEINPNNTNQIVCEAIIPSTVGGFFIRELGLYAGSTMVVNASYPPTYKPLEDEGGAREIDIKLIINIQNADVIALYLNDSLIYATRDWVNNNYIRRNEIIDNLTTEDSTKPISAKQGKLLNDLKFNKVGGEISGSVSQISDNSHFTFGNDGDLGFVKKYNDKAKIAVGSATKFEIVKSDKTKISYSDVFTKILSLDGSGSLWTLGGFSGNAASATKLATSRKINNVAFDGTADITVYDNTKLELSANPAKQGAYASWNKQSGQGRTDFINHRGGGAGGFDFWNGTPDNYNVIASIYHDGTFSGNAASATKLQTARTIGGVSFDGTANINLPGVNSAGNQNTSGNAESATKLQNIKNINGVGFDGSKDITIYMIPNVGRYTAPENGSLLHQSGLSLGEIYLNGYPFSYGNVLNIGGSGWSQIALGWGENNIAYRSARDVAKQWSEWKFIAFTDSNVASATKLATSRKINNVAFDGTADITVYDTTKLPLSANPTTQGSYASWNKQSGQGRTDFINHRGLGPGGFDFWSGATDNYNVIASIYADGTFSGNAASATKLKTARTICGFSFDGTSDINIFPNGHLLPIGDDIFMGDGNVSGCLVIRSSSVTPPGIVLRNSDGTESGRLQAGNISGNAASATKLQTARNIAITGAVTGSASFDGTGNIQINTALNNFSNNKNSNGYTYLGNGLILQWGTFDVAYVPGEDDISFNFNLTFPNACLNMTCTRKKASGNSQNGDGGVLIVDTTAANFTASLQTFNTSNNLVRGFTWFAVGY